MDTLHLNRITQQKKIYFSIIFKYRMNSKFCTYGFYSSSFYWTFCYYIKKKTILKCVKTYLNAKNHYRCF